MLYGISEQIVPRPPDWGDHIHLTGYWFPADPDWQPPDGLRRFVEAGPPPIFIGFGSMPVRHPRRVTAVVLDAIRHTGQRAVLHAGWAGLGQADLPDTIYPITYAPYGWLFPRMAAIIHHGGSGTTAFSLRAGVPSLVTPFIYDQFYWGRRLADLGVSPPLLPFARLTAPRLAAAIDQAVTDSTMRTRAAILGNKVRAEDGLGRAVAVVQGYVQGGPPPGTLG
jgi:sterol 3beta-glucosyltransferase